MDDDARKLEIPVPTRLHDLLDGLRRARVAVLSGPPGNDKRALVEGWLALHPSYETHWIRSSADLQHLRECLERPSEAELVVAVLVGSLALGDERLVSAALDLAERQSQLRVVLVSRSRPDVPLGSLAARGLLIDIDAPQLAWRRDEMAAALAPANPGLTDEQLDCIMRESMGWPLVGRLLARAPLDWEHVTKVRQVVDDYLDEEVLAPLSDSDVALLGSVAALPYLEPQAAAWMTGRSEAAAQLTRLQSLGVPIFWESGRVIRLNPLLRARLSARLELADPSLASQLREQAVLWLRHRGQQSEAISLAIDASLVDMAWMLVGEWIVQDLHLPGQDATLEQSLAKVPVGWALDLLSTVSRSLATPRAWAAQLAGMDAVRLVNQGNTGRLGYIALALGVQRLAGYPADWDVDFALQQVEGIDQLRVDELDQALLAAARTEYGLWLLNQGDLPLAHRELLGALGCAHVADTPWATALARGGLALVQALQGQVIEAQQLADETIAYVASQDFVRDSLDEHALLAHAIASTDLGDLGGARGWLDRLHGHRQQMPGNDALATLVRMRVELADGQPQAALRLLRARRDQSLPPTTPWHAALLHRGAFDTFLALDELDHAERELAGLEAQLPDPSMSGAHILRARLLLARGRSGEALALLTPLVETEEPFHCCPKNTLRLLMTLGVVCDAAHESTRALDAYQRASELAERLGLAGAGVRQTRRDVALHRDDLTDAERNVLGNLSSDRTLGETAEDMFISLNTLKTHLRRIYRKLGVANREEAIERARSMGIQTY